jgi:hypothetical protein
MTRRLGLALALALAGLFAAPALPASAAATRQYTARTVDGARYQKGIKLTSARPPKDGFTYRLLNPKSPIDAILVARSGGQLGKTLFGRVSLTGRKFKAMTIDQASYTRTYLRTTEDEKAGTYPTFNVLVPKAGTKAPVLLEKVEEDPTSFQPVTTYSVLAL